MRFASASAPALLSGALEAWERGLDDREAELAAKLLVAPRDAPCTRIDRDAPCTRILWPLDGSSGCPSCSSRVDGCCAVRLLAAGRRTSCASPWDEHCWIELRRLIMSPCPRASLSAITTPRSRRRRRSLEGNERVRPGHEPRHDRDAPCTRHDRDAPCTRFSCILWRAWCVCVCCRVVCVCCCVWSLWALWRPSPWRPFGDCQSRGGRAASRCGITMWHHDAASRRSCRAARRLQGLAL